jgi:hypothetical protein
MFVDLPDPGAPRTTMYFPSWESATAIPGIFSDAMTITVNISFNVYFNLFWVFIKLFSVPDPV